MGLEGTEQAVGVLWCAVQGTEFHHGLVVVAGLFAVEELVGELGLEPKMMKLIINRAPSTELDPAVREEVEKHGLDLLGVVPHDDMVYEYDAAGKPTSTLPSDAPSRRAFEELVKGII